MLANYTSGTLVYRELIVFSHATARGMVVSHIYVDDEQSLSGGHEIWGLPKELAEFEYGDAHASPRARATTTLLQREAPPPPRRAAARRSRRRSSATRARRSAARASRPRPRSSTLQVPPDSPFASPGPGRRGTSRSAGDDLRLHMPAPSTG